MWYVFHKTSERWHANHGWLDSWHSFSFWQYYDPEKLGFGALRVVNDDRVEWGRWFGAHPHQNMEIISIVTEWLLAHKDSSGSEWVIWKHGAQVMSAGSGIVHSEYNGSETDPVRFFQIWIHTREQNVQPRHDEKTFDEQAFVDQFQLLVSPDWRDESLMIHQDAFISRIKARNTHQVTYDLFNEWNWVYLLVVEWSVTIGEYALEHRDALGITELASIDLKLSAWAELLVIEVPM